MRITWVGRNSAVVPPGPGQFVRAQLRNTSGHPECQVITNQVACFFSAAASAAKAMSYSVESLHPGLRY